MTVNSTKHNEICLVSLTIVVSNLRLLDQWYFRILKERFCSTVRVIGQSLWDMQSFAITLSYIIYNLPSENYKRIEWNSLEVIATLNTLDSPYQPIRILGRTLQI